MTAYGRDRMKSKARHVSTRDREARAINSVLRVIINVDEPRERNVATTSLRETIPRRERRANGRANPRRRFPSFLFYAPRVPPEKILLFQPLFLLTPRYRLLTSETVSSKPRWDVPSAN